MAERIKEVWANNLEEEMSYIRAAIEKYPFVAMDTEFPGVVARPIGSFRGSSDYHYQTLRCNVDLLRIIQLGITLCDENGELAPVQLPVQHKRRHVRARIDRAPHQVGHQLQAARGVRDLGGRVRRVVDLVGIGLARRGAVGVVPQRLRLRLPAQDRLMRASATNRDRILRVVADLVPLYLGHQVPDEELQDAEGRAAGGCGRPWRLADRTATSGRIGQLAHRRDVLQDARQVLREQDRAQVHGRPVRPELVFHSRQPRLPSRIQRRRALPDQRRHTHTFRRTFSSSSLVRHRHHVAFAEATTSRDLISTLARLAAMIPGRSVVVAIPSRSRFLQEPFLSLVLLFSWTHRHVPTQFAFAPPLALLLFAMPATRRKTRCIKREEDDEAPYQPRGARKKARSSKKKERPKRRQPCDHCKSTRHRCIISSVPMEDEDESDDDAKDQRKLPCDACIASGRDCTYGLLEVDWQGRKRAYGILSELDERLAKLEVLVLRKTGATSAYELDDLDNVLAKIGTPQNDDKEPLIRDADDGVRRRPAKPLPPPLPPLHPTPTPQLEPSVNHKITFAQDLFEIASSFWPANPLASGLTWREPFLQLDGAAEELASALSTLDIVDVHKKVEPVAREPPPALPRLSTPASSAYSLLPPTPQSAYPTTYFRPKASSSRLAWTPVASNSPLTPPLALYDHALPTPVASPVTPVKTVSITTLVHPHQISPPPDSCLWRYFSDSAPVLPVSPPPSVRSTRSRTSTSSSSAA